MSFAPAARWFGRLVLIATLMGQAVPQAQPASSSADGLRQAFAAARGQAEGSPFDRPLYLQSTERDDSLQGDVFALVDQPYALLRDTLTRGEHWCGILILHLNVHYCRASGPAGRQTLDTGVGRKTGEPLEDLHWVRFTQRVERNADDHFAVSLQAPTGPMSTRDYHIVVEAAPTAEGRSLLHLRYAYGYGLPARLAMKAYLATLGAGKVGFSRIGQRPNGQPIRVGGVRGVLERNTLRYYLAVEAYLGARSAPPAQQLDKSLTDWFNATERYPQQLHEIDREAYLDGKRRAVARQAARAPPASAP
jgi:hypothetical protein